MSFDGLLVFNKPKGISSAKALYRVRALTGIRKSGHAGTLDPAADGVLLMCLGKATKCVEKLMDLPKTYIADGRLDVTSESFDSDSRLQDVPVQEIPSENDVVETLRGFIGSVEQVPPAVSALKVNGTPAYKLARRGTPPTLPARCVQIYDIRLDRFVWPTVTFTVSCGRGTYIRAIIRDLGDSLGTGGCLTGLRRTRIGPFGLDSACTFDSLSAAGLARFGIPLTTLNELLSETQSSHSIH